MKRIKCVIAVAMSGGVDSSVAAALLKKKGNTVIGLHVSFWKDTTSFSDAQLRELPQNRCCSMASLEDARRVAAFLNIPFYVLNQREKFKEKVVDYFVSGYEAGETPNPCVACNREMKFGALLERARQLGADYLATGHYARLQRRGDEVHVYRATDHLKDQSYFLYHLNQQKLKRVLFPVGTMTKADVRARAVALGLPLRKAKESQGICFIPDKKIAQFLGRHARPDVQKPGLIRDLNGTVYAGQHSGLVNYTIGQREGINIGGVGEPLYVAGVDVPGNTLIVGRNEDVFRSSFSVTNVTFTAPSTLPEGHNELDRISAVIRYRFTPQSALLRRSVSGNKRSFEVIFRHPVRAVTPGQSVVFYRGSRLLGGGVIR